jgi:hypothetical protein
MATAAYRTWVNLGRPFRLATPIIELRDWARANGVPVLGTIGNEEHLTKNFPEDHTPFSFTAWPVPLDGYVVTAIDLANVNNLGQKIEDQARAGKLPWLKYMNHSGQHLDSRDLDNDGIRWEETPSSDEHVHLSIRTDWQNRSIGTFNPFGGYVTATDTHVEYMAWRFLAMYKLDDAVTGGPELNTAFAESPFVIAFKQLLIDVAELTARPPVQSAPVDVAALAAALKPHITTVLQDPAVLAAIATAVNDEEYKRMEKK